MQKIRSLFLCFAWVLMTATSSVCTAQSLPSDISSDIKSRDTKSVNTQQLFDVVSSELKKPEYAQEVLPNDFSHFNQFLVHGQNIRNRQEYGRSVFGIFTKIMGGSQYVNAYAFSHMLEALPQTLKPYFRAYKAGVPTPLDGGDALDRFKEEVNNALYVQFSSHFDFFKSSPELFLSELAQHITDLAAQEINTERMRTATKRFLEMGINKLVWHPDEHEKIWPNIKKITGQLATLMEHNIIDDAHDLDEMYWTLIHRFNYFLDLVGTNMPVSFYADIKRDLQNSQLPLLTLEEQDICIQTKKECLLYGLLQAEAKTRALEHGILTS